MLISKSSPERETPAAAGPGSAAAGDFPLRRYLRRREDLAAGAAHAALLAVLTVLVILLGRALDAVCRAPAGPARALSRPAVWLGTGILALSVGRLLYYKLMELRQIRREMSALRAAFRPVGEEGGPRGGDGRRRS